MRQGAGLSVNPPTMVTTWPPSYPPVPPPVPSPPLVPLTSSPVSKTLTPTWHTWAPTSNPSSTTQSLQNSGTWFQQQSGNNKANEVEMSQYRAAGVATRRSECVCATRAGGGGSDGKEEEEGSDIHNDVDPSSSGGIGVTVAAAAVAA
mmetsp:Transcript_20163/g.37004  ORF Transcript_20163/g.37004 Transcript_20163/m.37004 type:complete len:148 (-) Transcript_20163:616-1059(-)